MPQMLFLMKEEILLAVHRIKIFTFQFYASVDSFRPFVEPRNSSTSRFRNVRCSEAHHISPQVFFYDLSCACRQHKMQKKYVINVNDSHSTFLIG
ncbi:CLUMA_CG006763, isoform A [Clunio marinus]|uniref:CLUMA_CG006763, isoform A n=1 Tax=Clunio marinus TaxID=568069 RepID=A0A1J1HZ35_9DIPT|nr:CLUMA_CG006763, isoform A [Clunio marinus]